MPFLTWWSDRKQRQEIEKHILLLQTQEDNLRIMVRDIRAAIQRYMREIRRALNNKQRPALIHLRKFQIAKIMQTIIDNVLALVKESRLELEKKRRMLRMIPNSQFIDKLIELTNDIIANDTINHESVLNLISIIKEMNLMDQIQLDELIEELQSDLLENIDYYHTKASDEYISRLFKKYLKEFEKMDWISVE